MGFVFEDEIPQPTAGGRFVFEDEIPQPTTREAEVAVHEAAGDNEFSALNILQGAGERTADIAGNLAGFAATTGANLEKDYPIGGFAWQGDDIIPSYLPGDEYAKFEAENPDSNIIRAVQEGLKSVDLGYKPSTTWEDVKSADGVLATAAKLAPFALETGLISIPDMAAAVTNPPAYFTSRAEEIAQERAANDGRTEPSSEDMTIGATTAAVVTAMEKFGADKVLAAFSKGGGTLQKVLTAALAEGATEYPQEEIEYAATTVDTEKGYDSTEAAERGLQGMAGGVAGGGSVGTVGALLSSGSAAQQPPAPMAEAPAPMAEAPAPMAEAPAPMAEAPAPAAEAGYVFEDELADQGVQRQAEIDAITPPEERATERRIDEAPVADEQRVAERRAFKSPAVAAAEEHAAKVEEHGLSPAQAAAFEPVFRPDPVTGFHPKEDRVSTVERAQEHIAETGEPAVYVEADIANLGGLNEEFGHSGADKHFRAMTDIFANEMDALGVDSVKIRHGGDEISAIVVGTDQQSVDNAVAQAEAKVQEYVIQQGLADLPHTKEGRAPGTGLKAATSEITPGMNPDEIFSEADLKVEARKKGEKDVTRSEIEETGPRPPEQPTGETGRRDTVPAQETATKPGAVSSETIPDDLEIMMDVETVETGTTTQETFKAKELMKSIDDNIDSYTKLKKCLG